MYNINVSATPTTSETFVKLLQILYHLVLHIKMIQTNLDVLEQFRQLANEISLVVVAIVGYYRTGKSYLMNRLAGHSQGIYFSSMLNFYPTCILKLLTSTY